MKKWDVQNPDSENWIAGILGATVELATHAYSLTSNQQLEPEKRTVKTATWRDEAMLLKDFVKHWSSYRNDCSAYSFLNP